MTPDIYIPEPLDQIARIREANMSLRQFPSGGTLLSQENYQDKKWWQYLKASAILDALLSRKKGIGHISAGISQSRFNQDFHEFSGHSVILKIDHKSTRYTARSTLNQLDVRPGIRNSLDVLNIICAPDFIEEETLEQTKRRLDFEALKVERAFMHAKPENKNYLYGIAYQIENQRILLSRHIG